MTMPMTTDKVDLVEAIELKAEILEVGLCQAYKIRAGESILLHLCSKIDSANNLSGFGIPGWIV